MANSKYALKSGSNQSLSNVKPEQDTIRKAFYETGINIPKIDVVYLDLKYNDTLLKPMPVSKRIFIVNGNEIEAGSSGGVENAEYIILLDPKNAIKKYGEKGKFGAIEAYGSNIEILTIPTPESKTH
ncbi:hypothetical protein [Pedobacter punctiformis]|uniref:Uncharacterized protein n=1 Tax=Pedobacter punctiformis TaxID=3004097 RepID=A0ABT4LAQ3_9SPHI|nr:hypothetical protein [Pedobacter sp. HCMS5-2]MCZ4245001.1 hypothetical protein [Pedobacter sp. HCMS5-2]